jgi:energy-converting hydrogenase A subunit M
MTDHEIVVLIQRFLDGTEWNADTLDAIATLLNENGYPVRDVDSRSYRMSKKDYIALAKLLVQYRNRMGDGRLSRRALSRLRRRSLGKRTADAYQRDLVVPLARMLKADNPNFDYPGSWTHVASAPRWCDG